jgi:hypothetical protein
MYEKFLAGTGNPGGSAGRTGTLMNVNEDSEIDADPLENTWYSKKG